MKLIRRVFCLGSVLAMLTGCATMFGRSEDVLHFESEPPGAAIYINNKLMGLTPCDVALHRAMDSEALLIKKAGYQDYSASLPRSVAGAAWFNLGFITTTFGAPSWGLDAATGHLLSYDQKSYAIKMIPSGTAGMRAVDPMEYVIVNYDALRDELASAQGDRFSSLCAIYSLDANQRRKVYLHAREMESSSRSDRDAIAWYRDFSTLVQSREYVSTL